MAWRSFSPYYPPPSTCQTQVRVEPTKPMWKFCAKCKNEIKKGFKYCPQCSEPVLDIVMFNDLRPKSCCSCQTLLKEEYRFCPSCQMRIDQSQKEVLVCSNCGCVPPEDSNNCPKCGNERTHPERRKCNEGDSQNLALNNKSLHESGDF